MSKPDFSGVMPTRMAEAQRRIRVIEGYLAIQQPSGDDTVAAARELGISRWTFTRLATSWRNHRDPAMLVRSPTGKARRDYGIDRQAKAIAIKAIQKAGFTAELSAVAPVVERECQTAGIKPPSRPTIYNYILAERRAGKLRFDETPCLVIGRIWFHLPIEGYPRNEMPCALVAVAMPERFILAYEVAVSRETPPSVAKVAEDLCNLFAGQAPQRTLVIERIDRMAVSGVFAAHNLSASRRRSQSPQKILAQAFGDKLGELKPVYRAGSASAKPKYVMGRHDKPLSPSAATALIEAAIQSSNAVRQQPAPFSL